MKIKLLNKIFFTFGFLVLVFFTGTFLVKAGNGTITVGNSCVVDSVDGSDNCGAGLNCVNSVCIVPGGTTSTSLKSNGFACTSASQCQSGYCVNSLCTAAGDAVTPSSSTTGSCPTGTSQGSCPTSDLCYVNGLCLPKSQFTGIAGSSSLTEFILKLVQILLSFAGAIAVLMLVLGGYWYMAAGGNEEMAEKGTKTLTNFAIGLVVIIMAYAIVTIISSTLMGNDTLIPK